MWKSFENLKGEKSFESKILNVLNEHTLLLKELILRVSDKKPKRELFFYTVKEAAQILKRSERSVRDYIKNKRLKSVTLNNKKSKNRYLIPKDEIDKLFDEDILLS